MLFQQVALVASASFLQLLPAPSLAQAAPASDAIIPDDQVADAIFGNGSVVPALKAEQYVDKIVGSRAAAFRDLTDLIDRSKYKELSEALFLSPFDDIMRSAFYLPWYAAQVQVSCRASWRALAFLFAGVHPCACCLMASHPIALSLIMDT